MKTLPKYRRGLSLMEVLISIFVLSIGLLGLAALIPVGRFAIVEVAKADRGSAAGWNGLQDTKVQGMVDPRNWLVYDFQNNLLRYEWDGNIPDAVLQTHLCGTSEVVTTGGPGPRWDPALSDPPPALPHSLGGPSRYVVPVTPGEGYAIDPLFLANNLTGGQQMAGRFPYQTLGSNSYEYTMKRVSLDRAASGRYSVAGGWYGTTWTNPITGTAAAQQALFGRLFVSQDDLLFDIPRDDRIRPRRDYRFANTGSVPYRPYPPTAAETSEYGAIDFANDVQVREFHGDYSFLITLAPATTDYVVDPSGKTRYELSVVVFYKRDVVYADASSQTEKTPERMVMGTILGGSDLQLTTTRDASYLDVREGEWILVCGRMADADAPRGYRQVFKWYRVLSATETAADGSGGFERYVSLAGPDWNGSWCADLDGDGGTADDVGVALFDGSIAVYTTTIDLDTSLVR